MYLFKKKINQKLKKPPFTEGNLFYLINSTSAWGACPCLPLLADWLMARGPAPAGDTSDETRAQRLREEYWDSGRGIEQLWGILWFWMRNRAALRNTRAWFDLSEDESPAEMKRVSVVLLLFTLSGEFLSVSFSGFWLCLTFIIYVQDIA